MLKVILVVGARPNFMKVAPIVAAMARRAGRFEPVVVHTGQHYDKEMSEAFFRDLGLHAPDVHLGVGSGTHAVQTAAVLQRFEPVVLEEKPDWVVVVGDVNSTLACALVCSKLLVKVAHVEAGLRSRDRTMPEEINPILTDQIADLLLTPSAGAGANLRAEGIPESRIRFVGNIMIDSLRAQLARSAESRVLEQLEIDGKPYAVLTLHRPSNVDDLETLLGIVSAVERIGERLPVIFPVHPRTRSALDAAGLLSGRSPGSALRRVPPSALRESPRPETTEQPTVPALASPGLHREPAEQHVALHGPSSGLRLIEPLGYLDFLRLYSSARLVLTDSGGVQEETTALSIPCLTLRENTERPITVELGTNVLVGRDPDRILSAAHAALDAPSEGAARRIPPLWDGRTADRILDALLEASTPDS